MFPNEYNHILVQIVCIYICNELMKKGLIGLRPKFAMTRIWQAN
jgi:hypothetical protein